MITVESLFQLIFNFKDYNDIGNFLRSIMGDQMINYSCTYVWCYIWFGVAISLLSIVWSHWHRAPPFKGPPKYLDLIYFCNILVI